jgi:hypothetical protein
MRMMNARVVRTIATGGDLIELLRLDPVFLQPVMQLHLHSSGAASRLAALLLPQIFPIFSVVAPCQTGASPLSVQRWICTTDC